MDTEISVVIPVFNSAKILDELYIRLIAALEGLCKSFEIILVDDCSLDESYEKASRLCEMDGRVKLIRLKRNFGQQSALMCGLNYVEGNYCVTMDDDLQNPPEEIGKLLQKIKEGYDAVYGIPLRKMHSKSRNLGAALRDMVFSLVCNKPRHLKLSSFRIMNKSLVKKIIEDKTSFVYISAIMLNNTVKVGNVYVEHHMREYGSSNYRFSGLIQLLLKIMLNYSGIGRLKAENSRPQYEILDKRL